MLGTTEVIQTCSCLLQLINGKKVLDIGTFTGYSALSWALVIPDDGKVITIDIQDEDYLGFGKKFVEEVSQILYVLSF